MCPDPCPPFSRGADKGLEGWSSTPLVAMTAMGSIVKSCEKNSYPIFLTSCVEELGSHDKSAEEWFGIASYRSDGVQPDSSSFWKAAKRVLSTGTVSPRPKSPKTHPKSSASTSSVTLSAASFCCEYEALKYSEPSNHCDGVDAMGSSS